MKKLLLLILLVFAMTNSIDAKNPFLSKYKTPYETPPFNLIKNEHYEPAVKEGIRQHEQEIDKIIKNKQAPTFENTIVAYEQSGETLSKVLQVFFNLLSAESNDEMMEISQRVSPVISEHYNNISLNEDLFKRVKAIYDKRSELNLNPEQVRLVEKIYEGFENSGATLSENDKATYRELSTALSQLTLNFGQNVLRETNKFEMLLTDKADLAGLPESVLEAAAAKAKSKDKEGWLFDLSAPSYIGFMKYSTRRDLREKLYMASSTKCVTGGEFDNQENVKKIAETRMKIANLFGYPDYATFSLRRVMAKNKENVYDLLDKLYNAYALSARQDVKEVQGFAIGMEGKSIEIQPWDWSYYSEKLKDAKYEDRKSVV